MNYYEFQISLRLGQHGWSDLNVWTEKKELYFCITHIFNNPYTQIISSILDLLDDREATFTLYEEPGEHKWIFQKDKEKHHLIDLEIESKDDLFEANLKPYERNYFKVDKLFFIDSFLCELNKIAKQLEYKHFSKDRREDFPWKDWEELKKKLKEKKREQKK